MGSEYRNPTKVEMNKIISFGLSHAQNQALLAGELLKAMDITACLSAERHAKLPCVTLMMDDLKISGGLEKLGHVLNVNAQLTRAFGSSMEVIVKATMEDLGTGNRTAICQAYFVFVAIAKTGKARLSHMDPVSMEERMEYALAAERRKIRFKESAREELEKSEMSSSSDDRSFSATPPTTGQMFMDSTRAESIELVLPSHANHHQTTFGGQIMAWLVSASTIAASKCCHSPPTIEAVNTIHFLQRSTVGDRLVFKAMVNKVFADDSMEVGCRVEASDVEGNVRHINSAYLIFVSEDENNERKPLPLVLPGTKEQFERQERATNRRQASQEKKEILQSVGPALSVPWSQNNSNILAYHNVSAFNELCHIEDWVEVSRDDITASTLFKCTQDQFQCVKVESIIKKSPEHLFRILDNSPRSLWDPVLTEAKVVMKIDDDDKIVHYIISGEKKADLLLLQSSRTPSDRQGKYIISFRSITLKSFQSQEGCTRKENLSSGFLMEEHAPGVSKLTYVNKITRQLHQYLFNDLTGQTKMYAQRMKALQDFLLQSTDAEKPLN